MGLLPKREAAPPPTASGQPETACPSVDEIFRKLFPSDLNGSNVAFFRQGMLSRVEEERIASVLVDDASDGGPSPSERLAEALAEAGCLPLPVEVSYEDLCVTAMATTEGSSNPSVWNATLDTIRLVTARLYAGRVPLQVVRPVSGRLVPGRSTLLLGPPGSGKSLFLKALADRLPRSFFLNRTGSIQYASLSSSEVSPVRLVGLVRQSDDHLPVMHVLETLQFADRCLADDEADARVLRSLLELEPQLTTGPGADAVAGPGDETPTSLRPGGDETPASLRPGGDDAGTTRLTTTSSPAAMGRRGPDGRGSEASPAPGVVSRLPGSATFGSHPADLEFLRALIVCLAARLRPFEVMNVTGLKHTADTAVGNQLTRGISGGERRRTTTAEVLVGAQPVLLGDEISTGLDSATAHDLVQKIASWTRALKRTTVLALLQPAPEIVQLFDDLILMAEGRVLYHGPVEKALPFFETQGFGCPPRKDPGSFLIEVSTPAGQLAYASDELLDRLGIPRAARDPDAILASPPRRLLVPLDDIAAGFWKDDEWGRKYGHGEAWTAGSEAEALAETRAPLPEGSGREASGRPGRHSFRSDDFAGADDLESVDVESVHAAGEKDGAAAAAASKRVAARGGAPSGSAAELPRNKFSKSPLNLASMVFSRQMHISLVRARFVFAFRSAQAIAVGLVVGSLFVNITPSTETWRSMAAVGVATIIFMSFTGLPQVALVFESKDVFLKQRDAGMFPASSYALALGVANLLPSAIEAIIYGLLVYFMVDMYTSAGRFFTYLCIAWSSSNATAALFRLIGFVSPSMVVANAVSIVMLVFMISLNGFTLVKTQMRGYVIWVYYLSPISWSVRGITINEFTSPSWDFDIPQLPGTKLGPFALENFGMGTNMAYVYAAIGMDWALTFLYTGLSMLALHYVQAPGPTAVVPEEPPLHDEGFGNALVSEASATSASAADGVASASLGADALAGKDAASNHCPNAEDSGGTRDELGSAKDGSKTAADDDSPMRGVLPQDAELMHDPAVPPLERPSLGRASLYSRSEANGGAVSSAIPFAPITLVCRDLCYYVKDPSGGTNPGVVRESSDAALCGKLQLLHDVSFFAQPGELMALMGGSGAGKTTLMDVVCGRKTVGTTRGEILVNGHPKVQDTWSRVVGYVEQSDVHSARVTVYESLLFSARLRLPSKVSLAKVKEIVDTTLEMVELDAHAGRVVGEAGGNGLSIEQRKRLSIAVELVANPSVVFMDEPTSGLDARAATIVMRAVRNVADSNRTVMVTIHQPSIELFEAFDTIVLMHKGGRLAYFGELGVESSKLVEYLEGYGAEKMRSGHNPATWMLEVTGGSMSTTFKATDLDFPQIYLDSELFALNREKGEFLATHGAQEHEPLTLAGRYASSYWTQSLYILRRYTQIYWHSPHYVLVRNVLSLIIAVGCGVIFLRRGHVEPGAFLNFANVQAVVGITFATTIFLGMINLFSIQPMMQDERLVFYRERAASYYSPGPYSLAIAIVELPWLVLQTFIVSIPLYLLMDFEKVWWKFWYYTLMMFLTLMLYTFFGQLAVLLTPTPAITQLAGVFFNQMLATFNGFLIPYPQIGRGWKWANRATPTTWMLYGVSASQLSHLQNPMISTSGTIMTVEQFMESFFDFHYNFIWWCPLILFAYCIFFRIVAAVALKYVSFLRR